MASGQSGETPRNIIFLIGDGMGVGQLSTLVLGKPDAAMARFPVGGFLATQSLTAFVTGSAAAGTAMSTGYRTGDPRIAMLPDGSSPQTLLEFARDHGKATGIVATSSVTHATPAAFVAHVPARKQEFDIAAQIALSGTDVIIGGGTKWFLPRTAGGGRDDGRNLLDEMREMGYETVTGKAEAQGAAGKLIWLTAADGMARAPKRQPTSAVMVKKALDILDRAGQGFVLMIEGSQIDWAGHDNDFPWMKAEMLDFDEAIHASLEFAEKDGRTLVVVTSDHETGGMTVMGAKPDASDMYARWIHKEHSGVLVPLFAFGPAAGEFGGIHRNDELGRMLFRLIGPKEF
jgi:alkaline phosphatase